MAIQNHVHMDFDEARGSTRHACQFQSFPRVAVPPPPSRPLIPRLKLRAIQCPLLARRARAPACHPRTRPTRHQPEPCQPAANRRCASAVEACPVPRTDRPTTSDCLRARRLVQYTHTHNIAAETKAPCASRPHNSGRRAPTTGNLASDTLTKKARSSTWFNSQPAAPCALFA